MIIYLHLIIFINNIATNKLMSYLSCGKYDTWIDGNKGGSVIAENFIWL